MKMKRLSEALFGALFLAFLLVVITETLTVPKEEYSLFENRSLAEQPEYQMDTLLDGSYFTAWETWLCDYAAGRTSVIKLATKLDMDLLKRPVVNEVVVTNEDLLLPYNEYEVVDPATISWQAEEMASQLQRLNDLVTSYGGTFLYVAVPSQYSYFEDRYPSYLNNRHAYIETEKTAFFSALENRNVPYLDIGETWAAEGNPPEYMSRVDHHYTWWGGWSAYQAVMAELNGRFDLKLPVLRDEDVTLHTLKNPCIGSRSRKLYNLWSSDETFSYVEMVEEIPFTRYDWGNAEPSQSYTVYLPDNDYDPVQYGAYMGGDVSETLMKTDRPEKSDLLVFGDSFTNALETVLYTSFDTTYTLDLRHYEEMTLPEYVRRYQPDVVLCIRDYAQLVNTDGNGTVYPEE